jgi:hypothetical protein
MDYKDSDQLPGLIRSHVKTMTKFELARFREELAKSLPAMVSEAAARARAAELARKDRQAAGSKQR